MVHNDDKKVPFPRCVLFVLFFEFCERFCFQEIFSIVTIYLTTYLQLSENFTVTYYHTLLTLTYLFPVFGAMLTYSFLGKFKLVVYTSCIYLFGVLLLLLSTIIPLHPPQIPLSLTSLVLITLSAGTLKPCIPLIGGDQFILPQQEEQLSKYFSTFNLLIVLAALAGKTAAPFLREHIHCFGENSCYSAAFGLSLVLITSGALVFTVGGKYYRIVQSEDNVFLTFVNWIMVSIKIKRQRAEDQKQHDQDKLNKELKSCFRIWLTILPFMVISGASDIRGTLMFFQVMRTDGDIGFYDILPDQFSVIESVITIPIFALVTNIVFPICRRCGLMKRALQKVILGASLVGISLLGAGLVSTVMEKNYPELPVAGEGQIRIYNTLPCDVTLNSEGLNLQQILIPSGSEITRITKLKNCMDFPFEIMSLCYNNSGRFKICEQENVSYFFKNGSVMKTKDREENTKGLARLRSFANLYGNDSGISLKRTNGTCQFLSNSNFKNIPLGSYIVTAENFTQKINVTENDYTLVFFTSNTSQLELNVSEKMKPDRLAMLWMMPHRLLNCLGEMIASSAVLEFCYSEAPVNTKNIAIAGYYLMISAGNIVIIAIEAVCPFEDLSYKFYLYAGLVLTNIAILAVLSKGQKRATEEVP